MKRKINRVGYSTLTVSLPSKWAKQYGLKPGDEVEISEDGRTLRIEAKKGSNKRQAVFDVSGLSPRLIDRLVIWSYIKGYDEVKIKFSTPETMSIISNKVQELFGFEVTERKSNQCTLQMITEQFEFDFEAAFRKAFLLVSGMGEDCLSFYKDRKNQELKEMYLRDFEVNKYCHFCLRELNKQFVSGLDTYALFYLVLIIEDVGDDYKELSTDLAEIGFDSSIAQLLNELLKTIKVCYQFFYKEP